MPSARHASWRGAGRKAGDATSQRAFARGANHQHALAHRFSLVNSRHAAKPLTRSSRQRMVRPRSLAVSMAAQKPSPVVTVGSARFGNRLPLALIAGPCALESRAHALEMAGALKEIAGRLGIGFVYKTSFDKANRTSAASGRGVGLDAALPIFAELRERLGAPVLTDVHAVDQCARV